MIQAALFSSAKTEWETPLELFADLDREFGFTLDPCCQPETAKCKKFYTPVEDGLAQDWSGEVVFMNPPYGRREIKKWTRKAREEAAKGAIVVCLIPARTDTAWWHDNVEGHAEVRFRRGRVFGSWGRNHRHLSRVPLSYSGHNIRKTAEILAGHCRLFVVPRVLTEEEKQQLYERAQ